MEYSLKEIINNIKEIYMTDSMMQYLLDFERVLDEVDMYVFENWESGELVDGPHVKKYYITCTFMWPFKKMPDPEGAARLLQYGCSVKYKRGTIRYPVAMEGPEDQDQRTKEARIATSRVWLVEIAMPRKLVSTIYFGALDVEGTQVEIDDLVDAYDAELDGEGQFADEEQDVAQDEQEEQQQ